MLVVHLSPEAKREIICPPKNTQPPCCSQRHKTWETLCLFCLAYHHPPQLFVVKRRKCDAGFAMLPRPKISPKCIVHQKTKCRIPMHMVVLFRQSWVSGIERLGRPDLPWSTVCFVTGSLSSDCLWCSPFFLSTFCCANTVRKMFIWRTRFHLVLQGPDTIALVTLSRCSSTFP